MINSICPEVDTYNRRELLLDFSEALRKQTIPIKGIY